MSRIEEIRGVDNNLDYVEDDKYNGPEDKVIDTTTVVPAALLTQEKMQRGLRPHHIQLIAISGAIGAGVFISIGSPLTKAGPLGLLIGVSIWCSVVWCFSNCLIEMVTLLPLPGGFVYYSGRFLDPSARFALGWNYCLQGMAFVCFELTALNVLIEYWAPGLNPAIVISVGIVLLAAANGVSVKVYGEVEFWISIFKVILILGLFLFTFISMLGGNPIHDRFGFRFWKNPGLFAGEGVVGRLKGIWAAVTWATFAIAGPDFISMVSGETKHPRRVLPRAFNTTIYRILVFYLGSALCVGINVPYNDPNLLGAIANGAKGAAKSPYVISMNRLEIPFLPHLVNAIVLTSVFSTASSFLYASSRSLYSLGLEGQAPKFVTKTNKQGVPYIAVGIILAVSCISYLAVGSSSAKVLDWFINLTSSCQLVSWCVIGATAIRFRKGLKRQGLESILPVKNRFQPYSGWYGTIIALFTVVFSGYYLFAPGAFVVADFIFVYGAYFIFIVLFFSWKIKGVMTGQQKWGPIPLDVIDFKGGVEEIEQLTLEYEEEESVNPPKNIGEKVYRKVF